VIQFLPFIVAFAATAVVGVAAAALHGLGYQVGAGEEDR
jgi:hypothetical protein